MRSLGRLAAEVPPEYHHLFSHMVAGGQLPDGSAILVLDIIRGWTPLFQVSGDVVNLSGVLNGLGYEFGSKVVQCSAR